MSKNPLLAVILVLFSSPWLAMAADLSDASSYAPGEALVVWGDFDDESAIRSAVIESGCRWLETSRTGGRFARVGLPVEASMAVMMELLSGLDGVERVEPNYYRRASFTPNDPFLAFQWHLDRVNVRDAWDYVSGAGVTVAVVDTGVSDGGNDGFFGYAAGYDFVDDDEDPSDENGHGTHVAGTIAQATNNGRGLCGIAYDATVLAVRVLNENAVGTAFNVSEGIRYAVSQGADVINLSLGSRYGSMLEEAAIAEAVEADVVVVAAAGNGGQYGMDYPARYHDCIAVGATNALDQVATYSNYGPGLDLVAPGGVLSQDITGDGYPDGILQESIHGDRYGYYFYQGTSRAAPHVAGIAALVREANRDFNRDEVREALERTAYDLGPSGWDNGYGWGLVDATAAIDLVNEQTPPSPPPDCTVEIQQLSYFPDNGSLVLTAECSEPSRLRVTADSEDLGVMIELPGTDLYALKARMAVAPLIVTVVSECGGIDVRKL